MYNLLQRAQKQIWVFSDLGYKLLLLFIVHEKSLNRKREKVAQNLLHNVIDFGDFQGQAQIGSDLSSSLRKVISTPKIHQRCEL